ERVELSSPAVESKPVRVRPDSDSAEKLLVGGPEHADARRTAIAGEEEIVHDVDQYARHARWIGERTQEHGASQSSTSTRSAPVWATYIRRPGRLSSA